MKLLCAACDEVMALVQAPAPSAEGSLSLTFHCRRCGQRVGLVINPSETQLVRSLGLTIGGRTGSHKPQELVGAAPADAVPLWTEEAEKRLGRVPEMARPLARASIERYAREQGHREITPQVMDAARARLGM